MSQIVVSCKMPIQWEQFSLFTVQIHATSGTLHSTSNAIFMDQLDPEVVFWLLVRHPIHVPPVQRVLILLSIVVHTNILYKYI